MNIYNFYPDVFEKLRNFFQTAVHQDWESFSGLVLEVKMKKKSSVCVDDSLRRSTIYYCMVFVYVLFKIFCWCCETYWLDVVSTFAQYCRRNGSWTLFLIHSYFKDFHIHVVFLILVKLAWNANVIFMLKVTWLIRTSKRHFRHVVRVLY